MVLSYIDKGKILAWKEVGILSPEIARTLSDSIMTGNLKTIYYEFQVMF